MEGSAIQIASLAETADASSHCGNGATLRVSGPSAPTRLGDPIVVPDPLGRLNLIPREWPYITIALGGVLAFLAFSSRTLPPVPALLMVFVAALFAASGGVAARLERRNGLSELSRFGLMAMCIGVPCFLYGTAIWLWDVTEPALEPVVAMGALVAVSTVATVTLAARMPSTILANLALWLVAALEAEQVVAIVMLSAGAIAGVHVGRRQSRMRQLAATRQREALRRQARAEEILTEYEHTGQGWFWETDRHGTLTYLSPMILRMLQTHKPNLIGRPIQDLFVQGNPGAREGERALSFHFTARSAFTEFSIRADVPGEERWWSITGRPVFDELGNFLGFRGSGHDLTEKRRSEEKVVRLAHFDSLTGLANRLQMSQTLERILNSPDLGQRVCAVFLLDLDRFKQVNDTMGHPAGDALLVQVAKRLEDAVGELGRVGRLGGDEFQVVLVGTHQSEELAALASAIIAALSQPYTVELQKMEIGVSIGIAVAPRDGVTSDALIRNADLALYAAKDGGRGRYHFYAKDLHTDAEERRQLEQDLRDAIASGSLHMVYQPVVNTATEEITGFEALMRWNHPVRGAMSPAKFIPIAEETGLIARLGEWALRTVCRDLATWPRPIRVAVNVSPLQFASPALPAIITSALASAQLDPSQLELEITESVFLNDDDGTDAMFSALKRIGVRLSLDDFGTGYSSLGYLKKAPFDKIKIDQSFVRGATLEGSRNGAIIAAIVSMAEALGMESTAEGVETVDELELVRMLGCSHIQGYIYDRPLSYEEATERLSTGTRAVARGPRSARPPRQTMLRKVVLEHGDQHYHGTVRNLSSRGAMIEGLWHVPVGTIFRLTFADGLVLTATTRWNEEDRTGVEFATPLAEGQQDLLLAPGLSMVSAGGQLPALRRANG
jgi:diguanylate cyclase (GGDEF)-like protein/PAS domain S-box-containing protein